MTPTLSVDAFQPRSTRVVVMAVTAKPLGAVGAVVSSVVAVAVLEKALRLLAASRARTR